VLLLAVVRMLLWYLYVVVRVLWRQSGRVLLEIGRQAGRGHALVVV
jgi:hypothetical protein